ncbi:MAG: hypothetical protein DRO04_03000 [Candidatus Iainarchaeum archaeon]|uniref:DEAD/DEAH box helicase family protein n=1 Tax=Candidatus Iainarchaeum sp. TaxID=3101447 RepID=A0A497JFN7_9ARCH|nr:MAG: hypothetical protein DRO04_03000 [Candidatus Diapherotrites archaeon]
MLGQWEKRGKSVGIQILGLTNQTKYVNIVAIGQDVVFDEAHHCHDETKTWKRVARMSHACRNVWALTATLTPQAADLLARAGFKVQRLVDGKRFCRVVPLERDARRVVEFVRRHSAGGMGLILTRLKKDVSKYVALGAAWWKPRQEMPQARIVVGTYALLVEGVHPPNLKCLVLAAPLRSEVWLVQALGRARQESCRAVGVVGREFYRRIKEIARKLGFKTI